MTPRQQMETISACTCKITQLYGEWAKHYGMSYNRMMILYALDQGHGCTQREIAEGWMIPKQTVNTIVKELERNGYVRLEAGRDRKEKLVRFTEAGRTYVSQALGPLYQMEERTMERMGPEQCRALIESSAAFALALAEEVRHGA